MITIFRRIREKLIASGSVSKYLLYAIGEILLVVIGILIALQVNNWNEARFQQKISDQTVDNLRIELQEAASLLNEISLYGRRITVDTEKYVYGSLTADSIQVDPGRVFRWTSYPPVTLELPILQQETGSDRLIMEKQELNDQLRAIKIRMATAESNLYYLDEFWNREVAPYFVKSNSSLQYDRLTRDQEVSIESAIRLFNDSEYRNLVTMNSMLTRDYLNAIERLADSIEEALLLIQE